MTFDPERIRRDLRIKRDGLAEELAALTAVPRDPMAAVSFGKRIGDGTTEAVERINRSGVAEQISAILDEVDRALVKLDDDTYGVCDSCGDPIAEERLAARPWSVLCVKCSAGR